MVEIKHGRRIALFVLALAGVLVTLGVLSAQTNVQWQSVITTINQIQAALANTLQNPLNGTLNLNGNNATNSAAPTVPSDVLSEGAPIGAVSPSTGAFT